MPAVSRGVMNEKVGALPSRHKRAINMYNKFLLFWQEPKIKKLKKSKVFKKLIPEYKLTQ